MTNGDEPSRSDPDILIAGAGLAGLTAAYGMAKAGFDVVCCGAAERTGRGRTVALLDQSVAFLKSLGLWADLEPRAAPLRSLRLIDDTGAFFPPRPVEFHAAEIGLDAFGWNIENDLMAEALAAKVARDRRRRARRDGDRGLRFQRRRRPGAARRRARDRGPACDRRRRPGFEGAPRRGPHSARPSLSANRVDRASRPPTAA